MWGRVLFLCVLFSNIYFSYGYAEKSPGGGYLVDSKQLPATLIVPLENTSACTGALVGPRVFVSAAHCFINIKENYIAIHGELYKYTAYQIPQYQTNKYQDFAIGILDRDVPNIKPYSLYFNYFENRKFMSHGFGCSGNKLTVYFFEKNYDDDFESEFIGNLKEEVALCKGDSGGPLLTYIDDHVFLVGVNRATNSMDKSYVTRTNHNYIKKFVSQIANKHNLQVCGLNKNCI